MGGGIRARSLAQRGCGLFLTTAPPARTPSVASKHGVAPLIEMATETGLREGRWKPAQPAIRPRAGAARGREATARQRAGTVAPVWTEHAMALGWRSGERAQGAAQRSAEQSRAEPPSAFCCRQGNWSKASGGGRMQSSRLGPALHAHDRFGAAASSHSFTRPRPGPIQHKGFPQGQPPPAPGHTFCCATGLQSASSQSERSLPSRARVVCPRRPLPLARSHG